jgi:phage shock protein A
MDAMREAWTDERLDDLNGRVGELGRRVDAGFARIHEDVRALDTKVDSRFDRLAAAIEAKAENTESKFEGVFEGVDSKFDQVDSRFDRMDSKFDGVNLRIDALAAGTDAKVEGLRTEMRTEFRALNRLILGFGGALVTAVLADTIVGRL